jgi:carbon monoxide dehydrogenase subunit G
MVITTRFELGAPIAAAWAYLLDVPKIAHCVPGASLTEVIDDKTYAGKVEVKLGPIGVSYKGRITIESMDETAHTVKIRAEGSETRGRGGASATMTAQLEPSDKGTAVVMNTDLAVSGVVAQFGRTGIMQEVAQRMAQRFASCVDQELKTAAPAG